MKHLKLALFSLIALFVGASILVSCSNDSDTTTNETSSKNVETFLKSFYKQNSELGNPIEIKSKNETSTLNKTVEMQSYLITEVFVGDDTRARGYIITEKSSNDFVFFLDVNRDTYTLTSLDVKNSEQKTFNNIDDIYNYFSTDEFNFIEIALDDSNSTGTSDRRFWGWQTWRDCNKSTGTATVWETYYVVGIGVSTRPVLGLDGGQLVEPCAGGALAD